MFAVGRCCCKLWVFPRTTGWQMRQNLGQLNLGQMVLDSSFGAAQPCEGASSCLAMWQLLPAGELKERNSLATRFSLARWKNSLCPAWGTQIWSNICDGHKRNWVRGCISNDLSLFPSDNLRVFPALNFFTGHFSEKHSLDIVSHFPLGNVR